MWELDGKCFATRCATISSSHYSISIPTYQFSSLKSEALSGCETFSAAFLDALKITNVKEYRKR